MKDAGKTNPQIRARVEYFLHRAPEELYDFRSDPDARVNLAADHRYSDELVRLQSALESHMQEYGDPLLSAFMNRNDRAALDRLIDSMAEELGGI